MKLGFIGSGNMAEALIAGIIKSKCVKANDITISDLRRERIQEISKRYKVNAARSNLDVIENVEVLILAVKPGNIDSLSDELKILNRSSLIISILAGISTSYIEKIAGKIAVIRVMPNTPALICSGMAALTPGKFATNNHMQIAKKLLAAVGETVQVVESQMDAVTAVSGSGPAYVFLFAEALLNAALENGLGKGTAKKLVYNTLLGSAKMIIDSKEEPSFLREKVTSKGGTTFAALSVFEKENFNETILKAIEAAITRSKEMTK